LSCGDNGPSKSKAAVNARATLAKSPFNLINVA
jgi:hypothetical protein